MSVDDLIAKAREQIESAPEVTKHVTLGGEMIGVQFRPLSGDEWRRLTRQHPPREGAFLDQNLGYNTDESVRHFPNFKIVRGDEVDDLRRFRDDQKWHYIWPEIFGLLEAPAIEILVQALWEVHEYDAQQRMIAAGKALRAGRGKKRGSRATSASQSEN